MFCILHCVQHPVHLKSPCQSMFLSKTMGLVCITHINALILFFVAAVYVRKHFTVIVKNSYYRTTKCVLQSEVLSN